MLTVSALSHRYGAQLALRLDDLHLAAGEHCALIGPSGSGKTTLLHILAGILPPAAGRVTLAGDDLFVPRRDDRWRARRIGLVPQRLHLLASLSALANVELAQTCLGLADRPRAQRLLADLGLGGLERRMPAQLSAGQQQRVAIARALVHRPQLLLADEPTSALDDAAADAAIDLLLTQARQADALLVVATHDARIRDRFARVATLDAAAVNA